MGERISPGEDANMDAKEREAVALFRMSLIGDLLVPGISREARGGLLKDKAERIYKIPGTRRTRIARSTLRDWMAAYEQGGLEALKPSARCDRGRTRALAPELADKILALREEDPSRSVETIVRMLRLAGLLGATERVPLSTVYRMLQSRGISRRTSCTAAGKDHRAFAFERPNQLWQSDVMYGPHLRDARGRQRRTYLITLLDDATRVIVHTAFCWSEKLIDFLPVFRQALMKRGVPDRLFVDNGAAYVSTHLGVICASLRVALIHARPYHPQSKGKIERWHRTLRGQLLGSLDLERVMAEGGLDALNARLWAWVEGEYHRTPHRGLPLDGGGYATPIDKWMLHAAELRPAPRDLDERFLVHAERLVRRDRTVRLNGVLFEAPAEYVERRIELRYDPAHAEPREVFLYERGVRAHALRRLDALSNTRVRRDRSGDGEAQEGTRKSTGLNYAELALDAHRALIEPQGAIASGHGADREGDDR